MSLIEGEASSLYDLFENSIFCTFSCQWSIICSSVVEWLVHQRREWTTADGEMNWTDHPEFPVLSKLAIVSWHRGLRSVQLRVVVRDESSSTVVLDRAVGTPSARHRKYRWESSRMFSTSLKDHSCPDRGSSLQVTTVPKRPCSQFLSPRLDEVPCVLPTNLFK